MSVHVKAPQVVVISVVLHYGVPRNHIVVLDINTRNHHSQPANQHAPKVTLLHSFTEYGPCSATGLGWFHSAEHFWIEQGRQHLMGDNYGKTRISELVPIARCAL